ncbi:MAG: beta-ketoacyl synthase N-terminal-like domain-containing protein [Flavobacteriales bacterium]|jgi:3-oxoacyl-[acyl-carrier-protein] synthase II|tara:strand:- start:1848 stop:3011 length:1164 start_codon:yes stop_codon:yes gene_type:complete
MLEKIIITGMGSISALGSNAEEVWENYCAQTSRITSCCYNNCDTPVGKLHPKEDELIKEIRKENLHYRRLDKTVLLSILAARQAVKKANWKAKDNMSVNLGSSRGATQLFEKYHEKFLADRNKRQSPVVSPTTTLGNISSWVAYDLGTKGASFSHSITCSTALHSVLNGIAWLQAGMAEKFITGGAEAPLSDFTIAQMRALRIYSEEKGSFPSLPLEKNKKSNSLVLGEAAAVFCLEQEKGQAKLATIQGIGFATELIEHNVSLSTEAECLQDSMKKALKSANLSKVDSIIMHAPGTLKGDQSEYKAIKNVFGEEIPHLISTKYTTGHTFGASGALSMELAILMLQRNKLINFPYESDPVGKSKEVKNIMINATGFGGNAVSIILSK